MTTEKQIAALVEKYKCAKRDRLELEQKLSGAWDAERVARDEVNDARLQLSFEKQEAQR